MSYEDDRVRMLVGLRARRVLRWCLEPSKIVVATLITAVLFGLFGCAGTFDRPMTVKPTISTVTVTTHWIAPDQAEAICKARGAHAAHYAIEGCATYGTPESLYSEMWLPLPETFGDRGVCLVGEEFLHALGAKHD